MKHSNGTATATPTTVNLRNAGRIFIQNVGAVDLLISFDDGGTFYNLTSTAGQNVLQFRADTPLISVVLKCSTTTNYQILYN